MMTKPGIFNNLFEIGCKTVESLCSDRIHLIVIQDHIVCWSTLITIWILSTIFWVTVISLGVRKCTPFLVFILPEYIIYRGLWTAYVANQEEWKSQMRILDIRILIRDRTRETEFHGVLLFFLYCGWTITHQLCIYIFDCIDYQTPQHVKYHIHLNQSYSLH